MIEKDLSQKLKGIWITRDDEAPLTYLTWLREKADDLVCFIPFDHPYDARYLGSIRYLDLSNPCFDFSKSGLTEGLLQSHFYPLGGTSLATRPELVGKGLARKIEFEIAKDLLGKFSPVSLVAIGASSDSHLKYCQKVGIVSGKQMHLGDYVKLLGFVNTK